MNTEGKKIPPEWAVQTGLNTLLRRFACCRLNYDACIDEGCKENFLRGQPATKHRSPPPVNKLSRERSDRFTAAVFQSKSSGATLLLPVCPTRYLIAFAMCKITPQLENWNKNRQRCRSPMLSQNPKAAATESVTDTPCDNTSSG